MDRDLKKDIRNINKLSRQIALQAGTKPVKLSLARKRLGWKIAGLWLLFCLILPPFYYPFEGTITSNYFIRKRPESINPLNLEWHQALDIAAPAGTRITASKSGKVSAVGYGDISGNYVVVNHWLGFSTYYGHMLSTDVKTGDWVIKGISNLGNVGSTGRSTGPHTHFELRWMGRPLPPGLFLVFHRVRIFLIGI